MRGSEVNEERAEQRNWTTSEVNKKSSIQHKRQRHIQRRMHFRTNPAHQHPRRLGLEPHTRLYNTRHCRTLALVSDMDISIHARVAPTATRSHTSNLHPVHRPNRPHRRDRSVVTCEHDHCVAFLDSHCDRFLHFHHDLPVRPHCQSVAASQTDLLQKLNGASLFVCLLFGYCDLIKVRLV